MQAVEQTNKTNLPVQCQANQIYSADQLLATEFRPPNSLVSNLIQEGLTILAGKPKMGKSLLAMNIASSLMTGANALGVIETEPRGILYLALEDTPGRMKLKLATILNGYPANGQFYIAFSWSRMDSSFFPDVEAFITDHPDIKLIVIDTYTHIRGKKRPGSTLYEKDYNEAVLLKELADKNGIAIVLIHHLRKSESKDPLDMISGSVGITGAADTILVLTRGRGEGDAILYATGRDIEEATFGLKFNPGSLTWEISGSAAEQKMSTERQAIFAVLKDRTDPMKLREVAEAVSKKGPVVHKHLAALINEGLVIQPAYGVYQAVIKDGTSGESGETSANVEQ